MCVLWAQKKQLVAELALRERWMEKAVIVWWVGCTGCARVHVCVACVREG